MSVTPRRRLAIAAAAAALGTLALPAQATPLNYATGAGGAPGWSETTLVVADFNLDGKTDIATVGIASGGVLSVLRNTTP